uniref:Uncharacterized protein n=1 Tax=Rhizophora mucronata TaxID=61149 RepID=A0A2P2PPX7_RHIMU
MFFLLIILTSLSCS